ncbi:MAG: hypothetical protein ACSLFP_07780 [Acidimicrobiales bacterium]
MLRRTLAAAAALGLLAVPFIASPVEAGPEATSTVAVLVDEDYGDNGEETAELIADLAATGHTVVEIPDITAEAFATGLADADVLAIPELEGPAPGELAAALSDEATALITGFVDNGGRILFFGSSDPTADMNALFGFGLAPYDGPACGEYGGGPDDTRSCLLTAAAANSEFADGPASLRYVNDSTGLLPASLPAGSTAAYVASFDDEAPEGEIMAAALVDVVGLVSMPYGDGAVLFYAWDWFPDADLEGEGEGGEITAAAAEDEAEWAVVLDLGVSQPAVTATGGTGQIVLTSDSPSTQPIFVELVIDGVAQTATIAPGTTTTTVDAAPGAVAYSVPGWGVGEGSVTVLAVAVPAPGGPAVPAPANPTFTG